jgi:hypothetical protein
VTRIATGLRQQRRAGKDRGAHCTLDRHHEHCSPKNAASVGGERVLPQSKTQANARKCTQKKRHHTQRDRNLLCNHKKRNPALGRVS